MRTHLIVKRISLQSYRSGCPDLLRRGSGAGRGRFLPSSEDRRGNTRCLRERHAA